MIYVNDILGALREAVRSPSNDALIDDIESWARSEARESNLSTDTYKKYRKESHVECHYRPALLFLEYLESAGRKIADKTAAGRTRELCSEVLIRARKRRFERSGIQEVDTASDEIDQHSGAYAVIRVESQIGDICQDLLILCTPTKGKEKHRYAATVNYQGVMRGHWHLFGSTIYMTGLGFREEHHPQFMSIAFLISKNALTAGVLTGLTTEHREPVTMPVILVKVQSHDDNLLSILDQSDVRILKEYCSCVPPHLNRKHWKAIEKIHKDLFGQEKIDHPHWFEQNIIIPTDKFVARLRNNETLVSALKAGVDKYCFKSREIKRKPTRSNASSPSPSPPALRRRRRAAWRA